MWEGFSFFAGLMGNDDKKCIGIDNFSEFNEPRERFLKHFNFYKSDSHFFYDMDYGQYFEKVHKLPIGFYLYDGSHKYEDQLKGLQCAEPFFEKNCIVMIDDTNLKANGEPRAPRRATLDFVKQSRFSYKVLLDKTTRFNGHPTWWNGVMVLRKYT